MNLMREFPHAIIYLQRKGCKIYIHGNDIHVIKASGENGIVTKTDLEELNNEIEQKYSDELKVRKNENTEYI